MTQEQQPPSSPQQLLSYGLGGSRAYGQYYRHSGAVTFLGPLLGFAAGIPAAILLGVVYAYADVYIPIIYLNLALALGFGAAAGLVPAWVMRSGKVRNVPVALTVVVLVTLLAYYTAWVAWVSAIFDRYANIPRPFSMLQLATSPIQLWDMITSLNEHGTWSMGSSSSSSPVSGIALTIVWIGEGVGILVCAILVGRHFAVSLPFCETCDRWCEKAKVLKRLRVGFPQEIRQTLEAGDFTYLDTLCSPTTSPDAWWQLEHHRCAACNKLHTLSVIGCHVTVDRKGNRSTKRNVIVNRLLLTSEQIEDLRTRLASVNQFG